MKKILKRLEKCGKEDKADDFQCLAYISEEVGELSRVLSEKHGLKTKGCIEDDLHECGDVIIASIGTFFHLGGSRQQLKDILTEKSEKWLKNLARQQ